VRFVAVFEVMLTSQQVSERQRTEGASSAGGGNVHHGDAELGPRDKHAGRPDEDLFDRGKRDSPSPRPAAVRRNLQRFPL